MDGTRAARRQTGSANEQDDRERGAALVEFAIVVPLLFALLFGIIEFGTAFNDYQSIRQGARDGARQAVVKDYGSDVTCGLNGPATGAPANAQKIICMTKNRTDLGDDVRVAIKVVENAPTGFRNDSVRVCTVRPARSITGFLAPYLEDKQLRTTVVMRAEKDIGLVAGSYLETDPSGDDWAWCS